MGDRPMSESMCGITSNPVAYRRRQSSGSVVNRAVPIRDLSAWQIRAIEKIESIGNLRLKRNWDSYGSAPIGDDVIDAAVRFVGASRVEGVPVPRVVPISGGGIHFEWDAGARTFEFEIHGDMTADGLICLNDEPIEPPADTLDGILRWLIAA